MIIERNVIISLLKLSQDKPALIEDVKTDVRIPLDTLMNLLEKLQNEGLVIMNKGCVSVENGSRLKLAFKAISNGADVEAVSSLLRWQEFESMAATSLEDYGYVVRQNVRFKQVARRWEIDVVGCKKPIVVCVDCKSWHHGISPSVMRRVVEAQVERTRALADTLPNAKLGLEFADWSKANFVPLVLVLVPNRFKFFGEVPVVSVLQLRDFLSQLPLELGSVKYFTKKFTHLSHEPEKRSSSKLDSWS
jgi:Holliday junction resolvase-like predicted endonuclease